MSDSSANPTSLDLRLGDQILEITWADGVKSAYSAAFLRKNCPCAECRTERNKQANTLLPILSASAQAVPTFTGGNTVGNYAIDLQWSDGHSTGIYNYQRLREWHDEGDTNPAGK